MKSDSLNNVNTQLDRTVLFSLNLTHWVIFICKVPCKINNIVNQIMDVEINCIHAHTWNLHIKCILDTEIIVFHEIFRQEEGKLIWKARWIEYLEIKTACARMGRPRGLTSDFCTLGELLLKSQDVGDLETLAN